MVEGGPEPRQNIKGGWDHPGRPFLLRTQFNLASTGQPDAGG